jgi:hypothetical protein
VVVSQIGGDTGQIRRARSGTEVVGSIWLGCSSTGAETSAAGRLRRPISKRRSRRFPSASTSGPLGRTTKPPSGPPVPGKPPVQTVNCRPAFP